MLGTGWCDHIIWVDGFGWHWSKELADAPERDFLGSIEAFCKFCGTPRPETPVAPPRPNLRDLAIRLETSRKMRDDLFYAS